MQVAVKHMRFECNISGCFGTDHAVQLKEVVLFSSPTTNIPMANRARPSWRGRYYGLCADVLRGGGGHGETGKEPEWTHRGGQQRTACRARGGAKGEPKGTQNTSKRKPTGIQNETLFYFGKDVCPLLILIGQGDLKGLCARLETFGMNLHELK